jgi:hypothetical protein
MTKYRPWNVKYPAPLSKLTFNNFLYFNHIIDEEGKCVCTECDGDGLIWDPNDPPCIIEGNKLRNSIKCPLCKGEKYAERFKSNWKHVFDSSVSEHKKRETREKERTKIRKTALKKLTKKEIEVLGIRNADQ